MSHSAAARAEDVVRPVPDAYGHVDLGDVKAPRMDHRDAVVDPSVCAVDPGTASSFDEANRICSKSPAHFIQV